MAERSLADQLVSFTRVRDDTLAEFDQLQPSEVTVQLSLAVQDQERHLKDALFRASDSIYRIRQLAKAAISEKPV